MKIEHKNRENGKKRLELLKKNVENGNEEDKDGNESQY